MDRETFAYLHAMTREERRWRYERRARVVKDWRDMGEEELRSLIGRVDPTTPDIADEYRQKYAIRGNDGHALFARYGTVSERIVTEAEFHTFAIYSFLAGSEKGMAFARRLNGCGEAFMRLVSARQWTGARIFLATDGKDLMGYCNLVVFMPDNGVEPGHAPHEYYYQLTDDNFEYDRLTVPRGELWSTVERIPFHDDDYRLGYTVEFTRLSANVLSVPLQYARRVADALVWTFTTHAEREGYPECVALVEEEEKYLVEALRANGYGRTIDSGNYGPPITRDGYTTWKQRLALLRTPLVPYALRLRGRLERPLMGVREQRPLLGVERLRKGWRLHFRPRDNQDSRPDGMRAAYGPVAAALEILAVPNKSILRKSAAVDLAFISAALDEDLIEYEELCADFYCPEAEDVLAMTLNRNLPAGKKRFQDTLKRVRQQSDNIVWAVKLAGCIATLDALSLSGLRRERQLHEAQGRMALRALGKASPYLARRLALCLAKRPFGRLDARPASGTRPARHCLRHRPKFDVDLCAKAWRFSVVRHEGQIYPTTTLPYVYHVGSVMIELLSLAQDKREKWDRTLAFASASLHDVLEDTPTRYDELMGRFGPVVADGVLALTKNRDIPSRAGQLRDSIERIKQQSIAVWAVKLADRIANLEAPPKEWTQWRCMHYIAASRLILRELGDASPHLAYRLAGKIRMWENAVNSRKQNGAQ